LIVTVLFDVVRWVGAAWLVAQGGFEQVVETIEAYRGTEQAPGKMQYSWFKSPENNQQVFVSATRIRHRVTLR
jgi:hypothetical protein